MPQFSASWLLCAFSSGPEPMLPWKFWLSAINSLD
jgi:hypothetical protein